MMTMIMMVFRCNLPLCCSGPLHQAECDVISDQPAGNELSSSLYLTVSVIRLLSLKKKDPERWKLVETLMDHLEERRKQPKWNKLVKDVKENIARHSKDDVEKVVGILLTNSVSRPVQGVDRGQALFPVFSLTSHSCVANTWRCIEAGDAWSNNQFIGKKLRRYAAIMLWPKFYRHLW